jgi:hypothetical protein
MARKLEKAVFAFSRVKERLSEDPSFKVSFVIIPFVAAAVLAMFVSLETTTRLFEVGKPFVHDASLDDRYGLWLSIGSLDGELIITTADGEKMKWPLSGPSKDDLQNLSKMLNSKVEALVKSVVLKGQLHSSDSLVALSVDQSLTFHHVRPIIYALAGVGVSRVGIETRVLR